MPMPNRNVEGNYRYGYQGEFAEKDPETGHDAFELRLWDSRIGRWLTTDPAKQYASPYMGMGNNPITRVDPDGGFDEYKENADGTYTWVSNLGRFHGIDFVHLLNGTTRVDNMFTQDHLITMGTPGFANMMDGYTLRDNDFDFTTMLGEFTTGMDPSKSLIYGDTRLNQKIRNSRIAQEARIKFLEDGGDDKVGGTVSFGPIDFLFTDVRKVEHITGQVNFSVYPFGDGRVMFMVNDSKSYNSVNPIAKFIDWQMDGYFGTGPDRSNYERGDNFTTPYGDMFSTTRQTYIWFETMNVLKAKHAMYGKKY